MKSEFIYFFSLIVGATFGLYLRSIVKPAQREKAYKHLAGIAIGIFLPIHVFMTLIRYQNLEMIYGFLGVFILGMICSASILISTYFITKHVALVRGYHPHMPFIASTFGGGGRAVILLAAILPLLGGTRFDEIVSGQGLALDYLAIFDVGYWLFYTSIVFHLLMIHAFDKKIAANREKKSPKLFETIGFGAAICLGMLEVYFDGFIATWLGTDVISFARWMLVCFIVSFSTAAMMLRLEFKNPTDVARSVGFIVGVRIIGVIVPFLYIVNFGMDNYMIVILIILVFVISPPSSLIDQMLYRKGAKIEHVDQAVGINFVWNLVFLTVAFGLVLVFAGRQGLGASS